MIEHEKALSSLWMVSSEKRGEVRPLKRKSPKRTVEMDRELLKKSERFSKAHLSLRAKNRA